MIDTGDACERCVSPEYSELGGYVIRWWESRRRLQRLHGCDAEDMLRLVYEDASFFVRNTPA
jgi:hypothetical protein